MIEGMTETLLMLRAVACDPWSCSSVALSTSGLSSFALNNHLQSTDCFFVQRFLRLYPEISISVFQIVSDLNMQRLGKCLKATFLPIQSC